LTHRQKSGTVLLAMGAPWPYEDTSEVPDVLAPSWLCPAGICVCCDGRKAQSPLPLAVLLRDHDGNTMGGARCRVFVNGRLVNDDQPYADPAGWLRAQVPQAVVALVEWAPPDTPPLPIYPYRKSYFIDVVTDRRRESARRRLHNLGFSHRRTLCDNIKDYQQRYAYEHISGLLDDVEDELTEFHDYAVVPKVMPEPDVDGGTGAP
jgi:hypothetical protein